MTCGACAPDAFRTEAEGYVYGYVAANDPDAFVSFAGDLHLIGAAHIFADYRRGNVRHRKWLQIALKLMRPGDRLLLASLSCLGTKPDHALAHVERIEAMGFEVRVLDPDFRKAYYQ